MSPTPYAVIDAVLDRTVAPGYSRLGLAVRRRLPSWPADPAPGALAGADVVVTGASSGLGHATAEGLARLGARTHLVVRDRAKGEAVGEELRRAVPDAQVRVWRCDLSDLDDVTDLAGRMAAEVTGLRVLVHNAGAMPATRTESAQGHEQTMALHVLGPVLLTDLMLPSLADGARVVLVTSGGMYAQRLRDDDLEYVAEDYAPATAYARSKRVQVELLPELARRWRDRGVRVYATHPGWADTPGVQTSLPMFRALTRPILRDAEGGADTTVWLAATEPAPAAGGVWHDRAERPRHLLPSTRPRPEQVQRTWAWVREHARLR